MTSLFNLYFFVYLLQKTKVCFLKITEFLDTIQHPRDRKFFYYDIALIKVREAFKFNDYVAKISLPCEKDDDGTYTSVEKDDSLKISGRNM